MEKYLVFKSVLMILFILTGVGLFYIKVSRLVHLLRAVQGHVSFKLDCIGERIKVLFKDVLGQSNVRRKRLAGLAHTFIFFGFLAVQPHSLEIMIQGVFPAFHWGAALPNLYAVYLYVADILAFLVLFGLGYSFYRRIFIKPKYLTDSLDARLILFFTAVIIVTFHVINAFLTVPAIGGSNFDYSRCFTVSKAVADFFNLKEMSLSANRVGYEITYWIHTLTILSFLVYIPGSKHLHLLAAIPNVFLKPLKRVKAIAKTDLEDEGAESFGLASVSDLNWKNILDLYACTECGRCEEQCPAAMTGKPLSPKRLICDIKHDLFDQSEKIVANDFGSVESLIREGSPVSESVLWACTTCRACEDICPVNIQHLDIIFEARKYQVLMKASFPPEMQETFINLENQSNPWGFSSDSRADWCQGMNVPLMTDNPDTDILYFVGCAGAYEDRGKQIAQAIVRILKKADVNFAILGEEERCTGDIARRSGNEYLAQMMIRENIGTFNAYKPKLILTGCPHCYNIIKNEYPQFGARYKVIHHSELFLDLIAQGRLKTNGVEIEKLAFHDSCYLGRWNGIFEVPRQLLHSITNGGKLMDMNRNRAQGMCCGAGGARMFMEENTGKRINIERVEEIIETGAASVAAACPYCITMLHDGLADLNADIAVRDIAEILDEMTS